MLEGNVKLAIKVKPICTCKLCGTRAASKTYFAETKTIDLSDMHEELDKQLAGLFVDPPEGWQVNGRTDYRCGRCK